MPVTSRERHFARKIIRSEDFMVSTAEKPYALSPAQLKQFDELGYVVAENVYTNDELQPAIDEIGAELDRKAREAVAKGELSQTYEEFGFDRRLAKIDRENNSISKS